MTVPPNPVKAWIPQYLWADAILHGKGGGFSNDIKAIYNVGGNFLSQGSDIRKNIRAFEKVEFSVCHDRFMTPTAGYCDVVLPTTTYLERNDIVIPSGGNYLLYSTQAVPPIPETRNDYDIFCGLAERLGFLQQYSEDRDEEAWLRSCLESSEVEDHVEFRNTGIYWGRDQYRVGLSEFVHDPERSPLKTPSGKVQIFSQAYAQTGYSPTPDYRPLQLSEEYPLRLVTPKSRYRIHSQNWNIPWFRGLEDHALWIHPSDATARSIKDGDTVHVDSPQGAMRVKTVVTDDIMPGVVCLLEGAWPEFDTSGFEVAGSVNVLTSTVPTRPSLSSRTHTVSVQVAKRPNS
jgi:anaerobic dimethyl sulfoxide reductase subunit A